ncbi:uncharacterized protein [Parasteatoda tepidariorum]|nr:BTB/POZ and MATH domain-containing protein 3-like isoform X2 [Parasteatoda tepidariorum]XP_042909503.1 BTB/POZ and MATH domain-containing protein 3-like isoform X2 [Parasteatoda tepidariorum]XP_042909504.1 BTB/POZ and MATH domain-containing protein 3-like isoform X2 [Parasteatoda tepidariorum]
MNEKFSKRYEGEWKISTPAHPSVFQNIVTPTFSPLPDDSIKFHFEAFYQQISSSSLGGSILSLFKLKLVKLSNAPISPSLEATVNVIVNYTNGCRFTEYNSSSFLNVDVLTFNDVIRVIQTINYPNLPKISPHGENMKSGALVIKCIMLFSDCHQSPHLVFGAIVLTSDKHLDFFKNLQSMYDLSMFSDFVFKVGDQSFPAHKIILSAHSPVFKNMMTHEFEESKTNSVTITDASPEIFDLFLRYLYSGEIEVKCWDSLKALIYLSHKYDIGILKTKCAEAAISILSVDSACDILETAYTYSDSHLKTTAKQFAVQHLKEIVLREDWKELVTNHPLIGYEVTLDFVSK